jgi:DNA (cytosine-5)-methyltransferase 1
VPTFGSLFAGIGGLDLGLERAGWTCRWQVEIDPFCQRVLAKHWPNVQRYGDIRALDLERIECVDLICGGFPCQPVSVAGKRLAQDDPRWLWPEFARVIRALRPRLVLVENVPGLLVRGLGDVLGDLAALGYDAEWECISAADVGAPHLRNRVWIIGTEQSGALADASSGRRVATEQALRTTRRDASGHGGADVADADSRGCEVGGFAESAGIAGAHGRESHGCGEVREQRDAPFRADAWWRTEPDVGRVAHGVPARVDRLRGLGNAVVPQVAEWIGRRLMEAR